MSHFSISRMFLYILLPLLFTNLAVAADEQQNVADSAVQNTEKAATNENTTENEPSDGKKPESKPDVFTEAADILLSPARYAIHTGESLFHHDKNKHATPTPSPVVDGDNLKPKWNHKLPFMAQKVVDMGFKLPNPYGFTGVYVVTKQEVTLSNLEISFGTDPNAPKTPVPFVTFNQPKTDSRAWEANADAWILPFLDVYVIGGRVDGSAVIPIIVPGEEALKALLPPLGALCDKPSHFPGRPDACDKDFVILDYSNYTGTNYGFGMNLAMGWKNYFVTVPVSYVWSHLSNTTTRVTALNVTPRIGYSFHPKKTGMLSVFVGATYLNTKQPIEGLFRFDTGNPVIGEIDISYQIIQQATEPWNYLAGFSWTLTPNWAIHAEKGFGGSRKGYTATAVYRW